MRFKALPVGVAIVLTLLAPCPPVTAQSPSMDQFRFMTGCWEGSFRDRSGLGTIEEHYTSASSNVILGTTRYIQAGKTVQYEFTIIERHEDTIRLIPYPNGQRSEHAFVLTRFALDQAVFESPEHDYPKRIIYRRDGDRGLRARIDAGSGDAEGREWYMQRAACS